MRSSNNDKKSEKTLSFQKIAISTDNDEVSPHFGRCPEFTIVEIEDNKIKNKKTIENPGHATGFLPKFFKEKEVDCVIAGGAGFRAKQLFDQFDIELITGIQGKIDEVIQKFIKDKLESGEDLCSPGKGKGYGIKKEDSKHD